MKLYIKANGLIGCIDLKGIRIPLKTLLVFCKIAVALIFKTYLMNRFPSASDKTARKKW